MKKGCLLLPMMLGLLTLASPPPADGQVTIHNPWIVNDRVADTHNLTAMGTTYVKAYTPDGVVDPANDEAKAINIYNNQKRRLYHWGSEPPSVTGFNIDDPTYTQNIFGWCLCGRHATQACTIVNAAGLTPMKVGLPGHWVYQVYYDGGYHFYDTMTTCYVYDRGNPAKVAGCAEIEADNSLMLNARTENRACPGFLLCGDTESWFAGAINSWSDYGTGTATANWTGNMDLRTGEVFQRTWEAWENQHPTSTVNADSMPGNDPPYHHESQNDWKDTVNYPYWEPYGQIISYIHTTKTTYRRWANGTVAMTPDFRSAAYQPLLYSSTSIATYYQDGITPDLHASTINTLAEAVFRFQAPFYLTDGTVSGSFKRTNAGDVTKILVSSNGTSWTEVWNNTATGTTQLTNLSLRTQVLGKFDVFYIKVQIKGVSNLADAGVTGLTMNLTFEHNKGAMAYLDRGVNNLSLSCGNPGDLGSGYRLKATYKWKEYDGSDWTIDKTCVKYANASPTNFTIVTGGTKVPRTEYIEMAVVPTPPADTTAPAAITTLACGTAGRTSIPLTWTAVGDDGSTGEASAYDLRRSTSTITAANFNSATQVANIPVPRPAGGAESFTVTGLNPGTTYYFAIKAIDEAGNAGAISNVPSRATMAADTQAPNAVTNLAATAQSTWGTWNITWTAPADNGNGYVAQYDLRWSTSAITAANFASATAFTGEPTPGSAGTAQSYSATGLPTGRTLYFAIKSADDSGNWSAISNLPSGSQMIGSKTFQQGLDSYTGVADSYMNASATGTNYGTTNPLQVTGFADGSWTNQRRAIAKFDLTSLPTGAQITQATLYLYAYSNEQHDPAGGYYGAYRVTTPWSVSAVTWNMPWVVSGGGDVESTPDGQAAKQTTTGVWYAWDVTSRVQNFIANPNNNNGWVVKCTTSTLHNQDYFYSSEEATYTTLRPKLVVTDTPVGGDTTAPAAVTNLATANPTAGSVQLTWTAPGDDGSTGTATTYDIRYSTSTITDGNWAAATQVSGEPAPAAAGTAQNMTVSGLSADTTYYFAIMTADEVPNWSGLSNVPNAKTSDTTAPGAVSDLSCSNVTAGSVQLNWTAPGDNGSTGSATSYDIRYSTSTINDGNWASATQVSGEPTPVAGGTAQNMTVSNLSGETTYYFAMKASDEVPNWSALSNVASADTGDNIPPAAVSDLATSSPTTSAITLTWTAPGDSGTTGTAASYDIRYRTGGAVDNNNWDSATQVTGEPTPTAAGTSQNMTVTGLLPSTTYYFAIKTADDVPNVSAISNSPSGTTAAPTLRQVGTGKTYATVVAAVAAAADYDTIEIDPGTYTQASGWASIGKNHLTIRGVGSSRPILDANGSCLSGKGIFNISGTDTTVQNLEFKNSRNVTDLNAAGIRLEAANLTIQNCYFHDNDDGILINAVSGSSVLVETSEFNHNGYGTGGSHNVYCNAIDSFTLRYCWVHNAYAGHEIKTRAAVNYILYNRIGNEGGNGSYEIQLANGGTSYVIGNQIEQSSTTGNGVIIDYGSEGSSSDMHLYVVNNTIVNNKATGTFVNNAGSTTALLQNNVFQGAGTLVNGPNTQTTNWSTTNAYLAAPASYYFDLTASSTGALNAGTTPGTGINGFDMDPTLHYVHPCQSQARPVKGTIDIGAFEYVRTLQTGVASYTGCTDAYLSAGAATTNYGTGTKMTICGYADQGAANRMRPIVNFDLSSISAGTTITSATLYVYSYEPAALRGSTGYYGVYPLTRAFTENQVTWNIAATGVNWTTPGGDFNGTADATAAKQGAAGVWYAFDVTSRVQSMVNTPSSNYGWVIKCTDENLHNQEWLTSSNNSDVIHRPKLVVDY